MPLRASDVQKLEAFLERIKQDLYPEPISELHSSISERMLDACLQACPLPPGATALDIGCGQGVALRLFRDRGIKAVGIGLSAVDLQACRDQGFDVLEMDQSFLEFPDATFDFVWCRHCLEHSIFPYFTLSELYRVLKPGGHLYVEVPAPDTSCRHQTNPNHYSVLGESMWVSLITRSGFVLKQNVNIDFQVMAGPDRYWGFILQKPDTVP